MQAVKEHRQKEIYLDPVNQKHVPVFIEQADQLKTIGLVLGAATLAD